MRSEARRCHDNNIQLKGLKREKNFQLLLKTNLTIQQLSVPVISSCVLISYSKEAKRQTSDLFRQGSTL